MNSIDYWMRLFRRIPLGITFFLYILLSSAVYLLLTPPFEVPDEMNHFYRAWQISQGEVLGIRIKNSAGGELPEGLTRQVELVQKQIPFHSENKLPIGEWREWLKNSSQLTEGFLHQRAFVPFANTVVYAPVPYLAEALALTIGKAFSLTVAQAFYLARFFNWGLALLLLGCTFFLVREKPWYSFVFFIVLSLPMTLSQLASLSPDALIVGCSMTLIALAVSLRERWMANYFYLFIGLSATLSLCKFGYFLLPFILLPSICQQKRKMAWSNSIALFFAALGPGFCWALVSKSLFVPARWDFRIDPSAQASVIFHAPLKTTWIFCLFLKNNYEFLADSFVGILGWLDTTFPPNLYNLSYLLLFLPFIFGCEPLLRQKKIERSLQVSLVFASAWILMALLYLTWTGVGAQTAEGLQGRYLLPLAPLVYFSFRPVFKLNKWSWGSFTVLIFAYVAFLNFSEFKFVYNRFWTN